MSQSDLVGQLLETMQRRVEAKVLRRLGDTGAAGAGVAALIDDVCAEERADLATRASDAEESGEKVQAEMYRLISSDLLPQVAATLRSRLHGG